MFLIYIMVVHQNIYVNILILIKEIQGEPLLMKAGGLAP